MQPQAARHAYRSQQSEGLTRVDRLLALLDRAMQLAERLAESLRSELPPADLAARRLAISKVLLGIQQGVDLQYGELPRNLSRLYEFAQHETLHGGPAELQAVGRVLQALRDGFAAIRDEAAQLEHAGQLPVIGGEPLLHRLA